MPKVELDNEGVLLYPMRLKGSPVPDGETYLYRYETWYNENGGIEITLIRYRIMKITKRGCWIELWHDKKRFVLSDSRKRFAYTTKEAALLGYLIRQEWRKKRLEMELEATSTCVNYVAGLLNETVDDTLIPRLARKIIHER